MLRKPRMKHDLAIPRLCICIAALDVDHSLKTKERQKQRSISDRNEAGATGPGVCVDMYSERGV